MSKTEIQHFVPQLLLRLHVSDTPAARGSDQVWCFDKLTDKIFSPNIRGILAEARFYEIEVEDVVYSLESSLAKLEDQVAPILKSLIVSRALTAVSSDERRALAEFCAVQMVRTRAFREKIRNLNEAFAEALEKRGINPANVRRRRQFTRTLADQQYLSPRGS